MFIEKIYKNDVHCTYDKFTTYSYPKGINII